MFSNGSRIATTSSVLMLTTAGMTRSTAATVASRRMSSGGGGIGAAAGRTPAPRPKLNPVVKITFHALKDDLNGKGLRIGQVKRSGEFEVDAFQIFGLGKARRVIRRVPGGLQLFEAAAGALHRRSHDLEELGGGNVRRARCGHQNAAGLQHGGAAGCQAAVGLDGP